jgi:predicted nucleic-acid-binding protein
MKAIDTNVLIRFLVRDDEAQAKRVYKILKKAELEKETLFVPLLVVQETIWVLESVYTIPRQEILDSIDELLLMPVFQLENPTAIVGFIASARQNKLDLSDLLIAQSALSSGCESIITFDRKASRSKPFELLKSR